MHLAKKGYKINTVIEDFKDGTNLIYLLEIIGEANLGKFNAKPKLRIQCTENLDVALKFIASRGVKLVGIGTTDIADGNRTLTLGLVWTLILRFAISELSAEGLSAKQGLLMWCQKKCEGYPCKVDNFSESFKDGRVFNALIHKHRPDLVNWDNVGSNERDNLNQAFDVCEKELGIPKLLDVEDIVSMPRPEEKSVMTYVAAMYKVFSAGDQAEKAGKRVGKYLDFLRAIQDMIHDYETRANALVQKINGLISRLNSVAPTSTYQGLIAQNNDLKAYRAKEKRDVFSEQSELANLLANIQSKLRSMKRPPYVPPSGLTTEEISALVDNLNTTERALKQKLSIAIRDLLNELRNAFARPANALYEDLQRYKQFTAEVSEQPLEQQLSALKAKFAEIQANIPNQLNAVEQAEKACDEANIEDNEFSDFTFDDLQFMYSQTVTLFNKKIVFVEASMQESKSGISPEQMQEFRQSFDHFDSNKSGRLTKLEFKSCLSSMGLIDVDFSSQEDPKYNAIWNKLVPGGSGDLGFDTYAKYMVETTEDADTPEQFQDNISIVAGGKDFVTVADMQKANMTPEQIEYVKNNFPPKNDGYNYRS